MTVEEYLKSPLKMRLAYRLARNPVILLVVAPLFLFLVRERFTTRRAGRKERLSVYGTNLALVGVGVALSSLIGWREYLVVQIAVILVAGSAGIWLFYVQHQFEGVYWERRENWDYRLAALQGSSFYKLPRVLQWFSGNIGFHHVHHLSPRIPNYNLERCHRSEPLFQAVKPVTFWASLRCIHFRLWDERGQRLVGFRAVREFKRQGRRLPGIRLAAGS
jgi:omega-6 fatty acid desaturase (delta-12 desaturase)